MSTCFPVCFSTKITSLLRAHHFQPLAELDAALVGGMLNIIEKILTTGA
jgi:hypothetical protein